MSAKQNQKKLKSFYLTEELINQLRLQSYKENRPQSTIICQSLEKYLAEKKDGITENSY